MMATQTIITTTPAATLAEAARIAAALRDDLHLLDQGDRISNAAMIAPRRRSARNGALASLVACKLFPDASVDPLHALIQYEKAVIELRAAFNAQDEADRDQAFQKKRIFTWAGRIEAQGPWDEINDPVSLEGPAAIPMPVSISSAESLNPFFSYLANDGDFEGRGERPVQLEVYYKEPYIEFEKGVLYRDQRMDLCKMVVGPQHISTLLQALRTNTFVKHFLLGNNLIGPRGAQALADFIEESPDKIETWYLAGGCIDAPSFKLFVDQIIKSTTCHSIWLKRNPLFLASAKDLARMIIEMEALTTLDIDQTQLGDEGAARLFDILADHIDKDGRVLSLETLYMNANGISAKGCKALARFLASPTCSIKSLYLASNPIGHQGAINLAEGLKSNTSLLRITLNSVGLKTEGATSIFSALRHHPSLMMLDVSHAIASEDLESRYNYIEDGAVPSLIDLLTDLRTLRSFSLGVTAISRESFNSIKPALLSSNLFYFVGSTHKVSPGSSRALIRADGVLDRCQANIHEHYGPDMRYQQFIEGPLRFLHNGEHVRFIDSVYRNRDAAKAKRGEMVLKKKWDEGDLTLDQVQSA